MEELLEKIENLKISLDNEKVIKKIKSLNKKIENDKELFDLLDEYKKKPSDILKKQIYNNSLYKEYKESETDINLLIISINNKLKEISNKRGCR